MSVSGFPVSLFGRLAFSIPAFSVAPVLTRTNSTGSCPHLYQTFKMLWQIFNADNVFVRFYFVTLWAVITVHAVEIFHCTIRFINPITKEVPYETFSISFHFHKNCPRKHFCFDAAVFHLSIKGYCKTREHRSYCFLSMFKLRCKRHYRNLATYSWCTTWREHVTKTAPPTFGRRRRGGGRATALLYFIRPILNIFIVILF